MLGRLFLLFVAVPLLELALLIEVGQRIGLFPTIAIVVATGAIGAALARAQGVRAVQTLQAEIARGEAPAQAIVDGVAVLIGGLLLLTPGILTDLFGFALLIPWTRSRMTRAVQARIQQGIRRGTSNVTFMSFGGGMPPGAGPWPPGMREPPGPAKRPGKPGQEAGHDDEDGGSTGEVGNIRVLDDN